MGSTIGTIAGGVIGSIAAGDDRGHAQALTDEAIAAIANIKDPAFKQYVLQQYQNAGKLTPELEQQINSATSQAGQVSANPQLVQAQMDALNNIKQASQTGMTSTDQARYNSMQQQLASQAEGQRQATLQNFAQRGLGGSGNELMAQLQASQNAANQANQGGLQVAGQAQQNALSALSQYGGMAGNMNQQQFGQNMATAQAKDELNRFNVQNQLAQQQRNVSSKNQAQAMNLQNQQGIMNANTGLANQQQQMNNQLQQQTFADQMQRGQALSGASFSGANAYNNMGNQIANSWVNMGQGAGKLMQDGFSSSPSGEQSKLQQDPNEAPGNMYDPSVFGEGGVSGYASGGTVNPKHEFVGSYAKGGLIAPTLTDPSLTDGNNVSLQDFFPKKQAAASNSPPASPDASSLMSALPLLAHLMAGGKIPGHASIAGDSYANDKVPIMVSPGEIVLPRSITQSPQAPDLAKHFVIGELKKQGKFQR